MLAILAAMNFVFEKQVEDTFKQVAANASRQYQDDGINFEAIAEEGGAKLSNRDIRLVSNGGSTNTKLNREERRLKARLSKMDEEK